MGAAVSTPTHATNDFELAIRSSKELEWILEQEFGASGKGLHEKITSASHKCPELTPSLVRNMRYLATIRNKLVHERGFDAIPDRSLFITKFETSQQELKTMLAFRRSQRKGASHEKECIVM
jgi:hypothetical protein